MQTVAKPNSRASVQSFSISCLRGIGLEERVIDERGDPRRNLLSRVKAEPRCSGVDDPSHAIGTAVVQDRVALARARPPARQRRAHFFRDDSL